MPKSAFAAILTFLLVHFPVNAGWGLWTESGLTSELPSQPSEGWGLYTESGKLAVVCPSTLTPGLSGEVGKRQSGLSYEATASDFAMLMVIDDETSSQPGRGPWIESGVVVQGFGSTGFQCGADSLWTQFVPSLGVAELELRVDQLLHYFLWLLFDD